ncbi:DUF2735 domain-containing protein [Allorhizobium sp. BGMRC 0089]|uniref:DUF2735 domain-containing protein n=1 Tax=Allorhizobium sonneratiae TaxID=2934936 RepID=UPI0020337914|nr:DUF2735 domain-containing protein [Allorhizobium sonneratiae]MCM2291126.1 DUF2735 domain-containing protein [Allorhizobium sonneratiae]
MRKAEAMATTTSLGRVEAKIYQFPIQNPEKLRQMRERMNKVTPVIYESGSASWYHEDAIREAENEPKQ